MSDLERIDPAQHDLDAVATQMAAVHAASFRAPAPWPAASFAATLGGAGCFGLIMRNAETTTPSTAIQGLILGRIVMNEAELLTLAVAPSARRQGLAHRLMQGFMHRCADQNVTHIFLEVAADNHAAQALYTAYGFETAGRRKSYYLTPEGDRIDALTMTFQG